MLVLSEERWHAAAVVGDCCYGKKRNFCTAGWNQGLCYGGSRSGFAQARDGGLLVKCGVGDGEGFRERAAWKAHARGQCYVGLCHRGRPSPVAMLPCKLFYGCCAEQRGASGGGEGVLSYRVLPGKGKWGGPGV